MDEVVDDLLVDLLGVAIGRGGLLVGCVLGDGQVLGVGLSIDRAAAGEDDALDAIGWHELQEVDERDNIVAVVEQGQLDALAHSLGGGEVDDARDGRILLEHGLRGSLVAQIYLLEGRAHTRDLLDAVEHLYLGVGKVVDDDHVVASLDQFHGGMATDEARSARH